MAHIDIDPARCDRDGLCIGECPVGLLSPGPDKLPLAAADAAEKCIMCGHCIAVCPTGALSLAGLAADALPPVRKSLVISPESAEQFLRSRRSVRRFQKQPVERELILRLIDTARYAPSGMNAQPVRWVVAEGGEAVHRLAGLTAEALRKLPYFMGFLEAWEAGRDTILRAAPNLVVAHADATGFDHTVDCAIALAHFELAAYGYGLGACWAGLLMLAARDSEPLNTALDIPLNHKVYGALMLGYPAYPFRRLPPRKAPQVRWLLPSGE